MDVFHDKKLESKSGISFFRKKMHLIVSKRLRMFLCSENAIKEQLMFSATYDGTVHASIYQELCYGGRAIMYWARHRFSYGRK